MDYKALEEKYKPIIQKIIDDNKKFYGFNDKIIWNFFVNDDIGLIATNNLKLELKINIVAVDFYYKKNEPLTIDLFILHEIRHIYQRFYIQLLNTENYVNIELAKKYKYEFDNYCNIYQNREKYYLQQIEFEAFMFSYSVMKYKYGNVDYIHYPAFYDEQEIDVEKHINQWLQIFKNQNL